MRERSHETWNEKERNNEDNVVLFINMLIFRGLFIEN